MQSISVVLKYHFVGICFLTFPELHLVYAQLPKGDKWSAQRHIQEIKKCVRQHLVALGVNLGRVATYPGVNSTPEIKILSVYITKSPGFEASKNTIYQYIEILGLDFTLYGNFIMVMPVSIQGKIKP